MRTLKQADLAIQALLIVVFAILTIIKRNGIFLTGYAIVGGWQLISIIIHFINRWHPYKGGRRYNFQIITLGFILLVCLMPLIPQLFFLFYLLVFIIPLLEVSYTYICFMEVFYYSKRPLDLI